MSNIGWSERLAKVVSKFNAKSNVAQFREDYSSAVRTIQADAKDTPIIDVLDLLRKAIESWGTATDKCPCCALREWSQIYDGLSKLADSDLLLVIAKKLPAIKPGTVDWQPFVFQCRKKPVLFALHDRRFIAKADLQSWITKRLDEAYKLPVLDLAVEIDAVADYQQLWTAILTMGERPVGLISREQILFRCFLRVPSDWGNSAMLEYLLRNKAGRREIISTALHSPDQAIRLAECLALFFAGNRPPSKKAGDEEESFNEVVTAYAAMCESRLATANEDSSGAAVGLSALRLHVAAFEGHGQQNSRASAELKRASVEVATAALRRTEEDPSSPSGVVFALIRGVELYDITHSFLRSLPTRPTGAGATAGRSADYERYLGKKEVIERVLHALENAERGKSLVDSLEVAMFNLGVRPLGVVGEKASFQSRMHEGVEAELLPGEEVEIVKPGRRLGEDSDMVVLVRAVVRAVAA